MAFPPTNRKLRELDQQMRDAESYAEWRASALEHDDLSGMSRWRQIDQTSTYDHVGIRSRIDRLRSLRAKRDRNGLLFALNEGIHGNMGGMGKQAVHTRARFGTKQLIEDYINEICESLQEILETDERTISFEDKLDFFKRASRCYGRSALMLSGAGALGHFHAGVAKALVEQDVLPSVISGSSAGSITAAVIGTQPREALLGFFKPNHLSTEAQREAQLLDHLIGAQIDVRELQLMVNRLIPDVTFAEAFAMTGIHINVSIAPAERHQTSRLLNAVTSPNVYVRKAVMASCAVPGVYPAVTLAAKNVHGDAQPYLPGRKWIDGSVTDDLPAKRLARLYGVNHYIASQVNPVALPFLHKPKADGSLASIYGQLVRNLAREGILSGRDIARRYAGRVPRTAIFMNLLAAVASQSYTADINIFPSFRYFDPRKLLSHLSEAEILALIREGERATWPNIERIRISSKISHQLDIIMDSMRNQESARLRRTAVKRVRKTTTKTPIKRSPKSGRSRGPKVA